MSREILAITNCRVSSDEQLKNNSLKRQAESVVSAAKRLGARIPDDGQWSGSVSSKRGNNLDRKDIKEMLDYCDKDSRVKFLIVDEPDRFMRSVDEAMYIEMSFRLKGVQVWYASDETLNSNDMVAKLMKFMKYYVAEGSNEERQRKSIAGQTKALQEGRYTFVPKPGYVKGARTGIHEIDPIKGPALQRVLKDIVYRRVTPSQGLVELNKSAFMSNGHSLYKMDKFRTIATDPYYAGIVEINKQVQVRNENGLHDPLLSIEEHLMLVDIFENKKKNQSGPRKNGNPLFPVSNKVFCEACKEEKNGKFVGLELHNGKNTGKIYEKYRCRSCKRYLTKSELHEEVARQFTDNPLTDEGRSDVIDALNTVWKKEEGQADQERIRLHNKIDSTEKLISTHALAAIDPANSSIRTEILAEVDKKKVELEELKKSILELSVSSENDKEEFLEFAYDFIERMGTNFLDPELVSPENRERCKQVVFPSGFYVNSENKVYTPEISELYRLALNEKDLPVTEKSLMVRVKRL